jgi:c-di-GMP-specific phosphodiesterase
MSQDLAKAADWAPADAGAALAHGQGVLWRWDAARDRLSLTGAAGALGFGALLPECSSAAALAMVLPQDHAQMRALLEPQPPGAQVRARLHMRGGEVCLWRGQWREAGLALGMVTPHFDAQGPSRDSLTGLLDRQGFIREMRERLQSSQAYDLVVADLDRLRRLNEALGHERADRVLATLGSRLAAAFGSQAVLARIGEDEFAVLMPTSEQEASHQVRDAMEPPLRVAGFDIHPSVSIGAVQVQGGEDALEASELLRRAELAVESVKASGGGAIAVYGRGLETDGLTRLALESDLRAAIERGEIVPYFQPIIHLSTGRLSGFEALARWQHPRRGLLMPADFLSLCQDMGLLSALGAHMLKASARQLAQWRSKYPNAADLTCSVNLSTGEIDRPGLVEEVGQVILDAGLPAGAIKLELTESDIMRNPQKAGVVLGQLRAVGAGLSLDDFGTGFSSLSYLTRLPFDVLKIDCYFVRTMEFNEGSAKIVRSVVNLGRDLALEVVAEGIENATIAEQLQALGCDYGQGFGYAQALPAAEAEAIINRSQIQTDEPLRVRA